MRTLGLVALLIGLMAIALLTIGASMDRPCQTSVSANRPDWWVLSNNYGTFDLIVYPEHAVVFDLTAQQATNLKNASQVGLSQQANGSFQLCSFR